VTNVRTWTGDPEQPWADALALRGDTLVAVGDPVVADEPE